MRDRVLAPVARAVAQRHRWRGAAVALELGRIAVAQLLPLPRHRLAEQVGAIDGPQVGLAPGPQVDRAGTLAPC